MPWLGGAGRSTGVGTMRNIWLRLKQVCLLSAFPFLEVLGLRCWLRIDDSFASVMKKGT